jgi:2-isopropylmalate synthase
LTAHEGLSPLSSNHERHLMEQVKLYDTTLRDGMQGQGMSLSAREKLRIVRALDALGVHLIEAGFPSSNPKEVELFQLLSDERLSNAEICAFGMTRRRDVPADEDLALQVLVESFAPVVTMVGKTWALHLDKVTRVSRDENLTMISDSIGFCRSRGKRVIYDAEHFFDAYRDDPGYALECLRAAAEAGAENVTLCDTNGSSLPLQVSDATSAVLDELSGRVEVGIHTHNDTECAVANSLAAIAAGARLVQGTINGYGERCGNANLVSILPALQLKMGFRCVSDEQLDVLTDTSHFVAELCNMTPDPDQPYVGRNAFAHKAGIHVAGVAADVRAYEHVDPELVGNQRDVLPSELSGKATVISQARQAGLRMDDAEAQRAVEQLKEREHLGYHYEAADASFELLLRKETAEYVPLFRLEGFRVITDKREDGRVQTEATIKIWVEGERFVRTAEGNGPVNALDRALRDAITDRYPHLADIELTNYKVRILDETHGTGAVTRVLLDSSDGEHEWGTIGVSENIIEASWEALVESLEYAFQPREQPSATGSGPAAKSETARK